MIALQNLRDALRYKLGGGYVQDVAYRQDTNVYKAVVEIRLRFQEQQYPPERAVSVASAYLVFRHKEDLVMLRMISCGSFHLLPIAKISTWGRLIEIIAGCIIVVFTAPFRTVGRVFDSLDTSSRVIRTFEGAIRKMRRR